MSLPRSTYLTLNSCYPGEAWAGVGRLGLCWREGVSTLLFLSIIYTTPPSLPGSGVTTRNHFLFYVECKWHSFQSVFKWFSNSITINNFLFTWWDVSYQFYHIISTAIKIVIFRGWRWKAKKIFWISSLSLQDGYQVIFFKFNRFVDSFVSRPWTLHFSKRYGSDFISFLIPYLIYTGI